MSHFRRLCLSMLSQGPPLIEALTPSYCSDLPKLPWVITPQDEAQRRDIRSYAVCSVDPPGMRLTLFHFHILIHRSGCTDIDDALHVRELENGNYEVGVHIADVSHFIRHGTALDAEASNRGTTVYLANKRFSTSLSFVSILFHSCLESTWSLHCSAPISARSWAVRIVSHSRCSGR